MVANSVRKRMTLASAWKGNMEIERFWLKNVLWLGVEALK
jgi:hypothetical protein